MDKYVLPMHQSPQYAPSGLRQLLADSVAVEVP